jgi:hypothetical protein
VLNKDKKSDVADDDDDDAAAATSTTTLGIAVLGPWTIQQCYCCLLLFENCSLCHACRASPPSFIKQKKVQTKTAVGLAGVLWLEQCVPLSANDPWKWQEHHDDGLVSVVLEYWSCSFCSSTNTGIVMQNRAPLACSSIAVLLKEAQ